MWPQRVNPRREFRFDFCIDPNRRTSVDAPWLRINGGRREHEFEAPCFIVCVLCSTGSSPLSLCALQMGRTVEYRAGLLRTCVRHVQVVRGALGMAAGRRATRSQPSPCGLWCAKMEQLSPGAAVSWFAASGARFSASVYRNASIGRTAVRRFDVGAVRAATASVTLVPTLAAKI